MTRQRVHASVGKDIDCDTGAETLTTVDGCRTWHQTLHL